MREITIVIENWTKLGTIRKVPNSFRPCLTGRAFQTVGSIKCKAFTKLLKRWMKCRYNKNYKQSVPDTMNCIKKKDMGYLGKSL